MENPKIDNTNLPTHNRPPRLVPALVLDMDGTIRRSKSGKIFINDPDDVELIPGIEALMWAYNFKGYIIILVSNQGGVAHGYKSKDDAERELDNTLKLFGDTHPVHIAKMCFHDAKGTVPPYNHRSLCRKPDIGMLVLAEAEAWHLGYIIDWDNSLFVGDRPEDRKAADNAGVRFQHIDQFLASGKKGRPDTKAP